MNPDLAEFDTSPRKGIRHMWVGHATSLVQMDGVRFMTDPIFSCRCSFSNKIGRQRYRPPPCSIDDLPSLDFIVISHNHYDHLDYKTVVALNERCVCGLLCCFKKCLCSCYPWPIFLILFFSLCFSDLEIHPF